MHNLIKVKVEGKNVNNYIRLKDELRNLRDCKHKILFFTKEIL